MDFSFKESERAKFGLCGTCKWAQIMEAEDGAATIYCGSYEEPIKKKIVRCTGYGQIGGMTKHEMEQVAWLLDTDKKSKVIGFRKPKGTRWSTVEGVVDED